MRTIDFRGKANSVQGSTFPLNIQENITFGIIFNQQNNENLHRNKTG